MRPRISKREAEFVLESLKRDKAEVEKKIERLRFLRGEIDRIRKELRFNAYAAISEKYREKKAELEQLEAEKYKLNTSLSVYASLIAKYEALASGKKQRGRYTVKADSAEVWLDILGY